MRQSAASPELCAPHTLARLALCPCQVLKLFLVKMEHAQMGTNRLVVEYWTRVRSMIAHGRQAMSSNRVQIPFLAWHKHVEMQTSRIAVISKLGAQPSLVRRVGQTEMLILLSHAWLCNVWPTPRMTRTAVAN